MKQITTAIAAHIQQNVTTLCVCIDVVRTDGKAFYYTDHDVPVLAENVTHYPQWGFARSAIPTGLQLEIDNLEVDGVMIPLAAINPLAVSREEIEAGLFDFAQVLVYMVNYEDTTMGRIPLRRGWIGEIQSSDDGAYHAEVRGLSQVFAYRIGLAYQAMCRADLGDSKCKIVMDANPWAANTGYLAGDRILGVIDPALDYVNLNLVNQSFESIPTTNPGRNVPGWTSYGDQNAEWEQRSDWLGVAPQDGSFYIAQTQIFPNRTNNMGLTQTIDLVEAGILTSNLDSGLCRLTWSAAACSNNGSAYRIRAYAFDENDTQLATVFDSGQQSSANEVFLQVYCKNALLPPGTRQLEFDLYATGKPSEADPGTFFDNVVAAVNNPNGNLGGANQYGGVAFICTKTGITGATAPDWSNLLGSTYTDGTCEWTCVNAVKVAGKLTTVFSAKAFTSTDLIQAAGWFDDGVLTWVSGANAGRSSEVRTWDGATLTMLFRPFYAMAVGDQFVVYPGCQKTFTDCKDKFDNVINFRGEPSVPGNDQYMTVPNQPSSSSGGSKL